MAELLASGFCTVYALHELHGSFPHYWYDTSINVIPGTFYDNKHRLSSLDVHSSMGSDDLHPCFIKSCPSLAIPLPLDWKKSVIIPLFKKNYRPISLTSLCCKVVERIITTTLYDHFSQNYVLSDEQYGFRQGRTVDDQLLLVYDDVSSWLDLGFAVDVILFDFAIAFSVVCHNTLFDKLILLGVCGPLFSLISDFLIGRTMIFSITGVSSSIKLVCNGVLQGLVQLKM